MHQRECRFRRDIHHQIARQLVETAKDTERGIALEDLTGIRDRTRFRKSQRAKIHGWSFGQLLKVPMVGGCPPTATPVGAGVASHKPLALAMGYLTLDSTPHGTTRCFRRKRA